MNVQTSPLAPLQTLKSFTRHCPVLPPSIFALIVQHSISFTPRLRYSSLLNHNKSLLIPIITAFDRQDSHGTALEKFDQFVLVDGPRVRQIAIDPVYHDPNATMRATFRASAPPAEITSMGRFQTRCLPALVGGSDFDESHPCAVKDVAPPCWVILLLHSQWLRMPIGISLEGQINELEVPWFGEGSSVADIACPLTR